MGKNFMEERRHTCFFEAVATAGHRLLLVDYEKALASAPGRCTPYPGVSDRLQRVLNDRGTRLVVISARPAQDVRLALGMPVTPEIWGGDGLERLYSDGHYECAELDVPTEALEAMAESETTLRRKGLGKFLEVNLAAISVHWTGLSDIDDLLDVRSKAYQVFRPLALRHSSLRIVGIEGGVELRLRGTTKGDALRRLLSSVTVETPVAYVGDNRTNPEVFQALDGRDLTAVVTVSPRVAGAAVWPHEEFTRFLDEWIRTTQCISSES